MLFENRQVFYEQTTLLPPGKPIQFTFTPNASPSANHFKLRLRGDAGVHPSWMWEGGYPLLYREIDDALCTEVTREQQFSLKLAMNGEDYPRRAYYKLLCPFDLTPQFPASNGGLGAFRFSIWCKTEEVTLCDTGSFAVEIRVWDKKEGRDARDICGPEDSLFVLPLPTGTNDWEEITKDLVVTADTAALLITIEAKRACGTAYLEAPAFTSAVGEQLLPQFTVSNPHHPYLNWFGENLSHKEWTDLSVTLNGVALPVWTLFQRCHRGSENELPLPDGLIKTGENTLTLCNANDYFAPHPYKLMRAELLSEPALPFKVLASPKTVCAGKHIMLLLETEQPDIKLTVCCKNGAAFPERVVFSEPGLHVLKGSAGEAGPGFSLTLSSGGTTVSVFVDRIVARGEDGVLTGTGDSIYIPQDNVGLMREFLCWYLNNRIGNFITFRPVYRWTGARELAPATWKEIKNLCEEMEIPYCHMIDGRELPGENANPSKAMLDGPFFIGNQGHERDGALYYWGQRPMDYENLFFNELFCRGHVHPDYLYGSPIAYTDHGIYLYTDPVTPKDMKEAAAQYVEKAALMLKGIKRHTGPSVLFRYFFQAGLQVGGAELMYGPQEIVLAALRGATRAYHRKEFAAHLAVQWSTTPHDTNERYRRYQLALFVSYLQGVHHINTEEGLYRMEEDFAVFDRFSDACRAHLHVQQEFTEYVETHTRRGKMLSPLGIIHGRYDPWVCFTRRSAWNHAGEEWKFNRPEESWDLLKVLYPDSVLSALYCHPCPNSPQGFTSRTPYGTSDILPIEAEPALLREYPYLAFLGYHAAEPGDLTKLWSYVAEGGVLLLSWAHLITSLNRAELLSDTPSLLCGRALTGVELLRFENGWGVLGDSESVEVLEQRNGKPLVLRHTLGKGSVLLINSLKFPADPEIRPLYETYLRSLALEAAKGEYQKGWATSNDTVQTAVYDGEDRRTVYLIHTGWWREEETADALLHLAGREIPLSVPRGVIASAAVFGEIGIWITDNRTEVLSLKRQGDLLSIRLQGLGETRITLLLPEGLAPDGLTPLGNGCFQLDRAIDGVQQMDLLLHKGNG